MKTKTMLTILCVGIAFLMIVGVTKARAECCFLDVVTAPVVAAGVVAGTAVTAAATIAVAPFQALAGCCPVSYAPPAACCPGYSPRVAWVPDYYGRYDGGGPRY